MSRRLPSGFKAAAETTSNRLMRLEGVGLKELKQLFNASQFELERRLQRMVTKGTFTGAQMTSALAQIKVAQARMAREMAGLTGDIIRDVQVEGLADMIRDIKKFERKFAGLVTPIPIQEATRFWGVVDKRRSILRKMTKSSMKKYGSHLVEAMEKEMGLALATGKSGQETIKKIQKVADLEWWQAERIMRTETAYAFNVTAADAVQDAKSDLPDMMMRWSEHVDDATGQPLDKRVGVDSLAMHGQVVVAGGAFTMPPSAPNGKSVAASLIGKQWTHPPNRPNDRAVVQPWRPHWGIPVWEWRNGRRVSIGSR